MHSVELMEEAITLSKRLGWQIRYEFLGEVGGGACEIGKAKWIFIDLALSPLDQFDQVIQALQADPAVYGEDIPEELAGYFEVRRAA